MWDKLTPPSDVKLQAVLGWGPGFLPQTSHTTVWMASHPSLFLHPLPTLSSLASFSSQFHFSSDLSLHPLPSLRHLVSIVSSLRPFSTFFLPSPLTWFPFLYLSFHLASSAPVSSPLLVLHSLISWFLPMQQFLLCPNQMLHTVKGKCQVQMLHTRREHSKCTLFTERKDGVI